MGGASVSVVLGVCEEVLPLDRNVSMTISLYRGNYSQWDYCCTAICCYLALKLPVPNGTCSRKEKTHSIYLPLLL